MHHALQQRAAEETQTLFIEGSCLAEPLWMRHKAKHGNEKQVRKAFKDF